MFVLGIDWSKLRKVNAGVLFVIMFVALLNRANRVPINTVSTGLTLCWNDEQSLQNCEQVKEKTNVAETGNWGTSCEHVFPLKQNRRKESVVI